MHNYDEDSEACLSRQILNKSVKTKAMEDLCERSRKLIHKELRSQDLDALIYIYRTLAGTFIKHASPNCILSRNILKKLAILQCVSQYFCSCICTAKKKKMRPTSK